MTREDITEMVREAREQTMKELPPNTFDLDLFHERFAALVAAQEREACRQWFIEDSERFAKLVAAAEREACAKVAKETVCDMHLGTGIKIYGTRAAAAIRARGQE
jgi:hypothetical protein